MKKILKYSVCLLIFSLSTSCAVRKNNWATRNYHALVTHYNIYFNGNQSFLEGIKTQNNASGEDFSKILPLYTVSIPGNATSASGNMDKTIEKCRKAIKLHSIQKKPKTDYKKLKDQKYQVFLKKEEYNPQLKYAWLLLGKAEFHKGDFIGASATFNYINRHFATEPGVVLVSKIWQARAYAEMEWLYEAEEILSKINPSDITYKHEALFASAYADLLLKQKKYNEAATYLKTVLLRESDKTQKTRCNYILAQLNQLSRNDKEAELYYSAVIKSNPAYTMVFNAQINRAQLVGGANSKSVLKSLNKMAKNEKNKDYLDQVYYAIGNIHLKNGDKKTAIENYKTAIEKSTRNGMEKATVQIKLADLYFSDRMYIDAQPYYEDASKILKSEHEDYKRVSKLANILTELSSDYKTVVLQDSLQKLAKMPEKEKLAIIDKVIENLIKEEELQKQKEEEAAYAAQRESNADNSLPSFKNSTDWYFYNPNLINKGRAEFQRKWGKRALEDNWRRKNKIQLIDESTENMYADDSESETSEEKKTFILTDNKTPEFYLAQLPNTPAKVEQSNLLIANALANMGYIYYVKLEDLDLATETYNELQRRFPKHEKIAESYFYCYQIAQKENQSADAQRYRTIILSRYADTKYGLLLSKPDYANSLASMYTMQDSLYAETYSAYSKGNFNQVYKNYGYMSKNFPLSKLMPKFTFLNAMSIGKTMPQEFFKNALDTLINTYPQSDVTAMSKDILALMSQGKEAQQGSTHGSLLLKREDMQQESIDEENEKKEFSTDTNVPFMIIVKITVGEKEANMLLFDIAAYNFSKFMIKDFDLNLQKQAENNYQLTISNFESVKEADWYYKMITEDESLKKKVSGYKKTFISEDNFKLLNAPFSWEEYVNFYENKIKKE